MFTIKAPNLKYNGVSASLQFANGEAKTNDEWLAEWFERKGYEVIEEEKEVDQDGEGDKEPTNDELKAELDKLGVKYKANDTKSV
jgi:hypothetical protein